MPLNVHGKSSHLQNAINNFDHGYHTDYFWVRNLFKDYLINRTTPNVQNVSQALSCVLNRWGAGRRKAPRVQTLGNIVATLSDVRVVDLLTKFSGSSITYFTINAANVRVINDPKRWSNIQDFDKDLIDVLERLANGILDANTNVTYPMKILLLLTGFMPALDSQVRKGLGCAGFKRTNVTQFQMPSVVDAANPLSTVEAKILTRLPFYLGDCYTRPKNTLLLNHAVSTTKSGLNNEHGRLFDILLFEHRGAPRYLVFSPTNTDWFNIT